jgi:hypothetical protein
MKRFQGPQDVDAGKVDGIARSPTDTASKLEPKLQNRECLVSAWLSARSAALMTKIAPPLL